MVTIGSCCRLAMESLGAGTAASAGVVKQQQGECQPPHAPAGAIKAAPFQQGFDVGIAATEGAIGGGEIAGAAGRIDKLVQSLGGGGIERILRFLERVEAVGVQALPTTDRRNSPPNSRRRQKYG